MKRHLSLLTSVLFAGAATLAAQNPSAPPIQNPPTPSSQTPPAPAPQAPSTPRVPDAHQATHPTEKSSASDLAFANKIAAGGEAEVGLATLAQEKGSADEVKKLASRLHDDHMKANEKLKGIASQKGWQLSTAPTAEQQATKDKLDKLTGNAFDRAWTSAMVNGHRTNIKAFEQEASKGTDADLKGFASETLPTLKEHLDMAMKAQQAVTASNRTN